MLGNNIYIVNWSNLIQWLMITFLRKSKHWEWLRVNLFPVIWLNAKFEVFRQDISYSMNLSSQTVQIERLLNDRYDEIQRRIFIRDGAFRDGNYLYRYLEQPKYVGIYDNGKYIQSINQFNAPVTVHFYVVVPIGLLYENVQMTSLIERYKALGYTFLIIEE